MSDLNASAMNMKAVTDAREHHDRTCRWNGKAVEVHLNAVDISRMGWESGDYIAGLVVVSDEKVALGRLRVYCDLELGGAQPAQDISENITVKREEPLTV